MKNILFVVCIFCFGFASCGKHNSGNQLTKPIPKDSTVSSPAIFVPYTDTFSGTFSVKIGDPNYRDSTRIQSDIFVNHIDSAHITIVGSGVAANGFNASVPTTFNNYQVHYYIAMGSGNLYYFHPYQHAEDQIEFKSDSLYLSIFREPGNCMVWELQSFAGKAKH